MNIISMIILSIFLHIVDDYYLQGWLASAKQKKYWEEKAPDEMYKYDYIWALIMHSFSWSFMIMLPIFIMVKFTVTVGILMIFIVNIIIHASTDNLKANKKTINLWEDQFIHLIQIIVTYLFFL